MYIPEGSHLELRSMRWPRLWRAQSAPQPLKGGGLLYNVSWLDDRGNSVKGGEREVRNLDTTAQ